MPLIGSWFCAPLVLTTGGEYWLWLQSSGFAPRWDDSRSVKGALAVTFSGTAMPGKSAPVMTIGSTARFGGIVGSTTGRLTGSAEEAPHAAPAHAASAATTMASFTATFKRISLLQESGVPGEINAPDGRNWRGERA